MPDLVTTDFPSMDAAIPAFINMLQAHPDVYACFGFNLSSQQYFICQLPSPETFIQLISSESLLPTFLGFNADFINLVSHATLYLVGSIK